MKILQQLREAKPSTQNGRERNSDTHQKFTPAEEITSLRMWVKHTVDSTGHYAKLLKITKPHGKEGKQYQADGGQGILRMAHT